MKLIRHGSINKEKTGIVIGDTYYDSSAFGEDYNEAFFETGGLERLKAFVLSSKVTGTDDTPVRVLDKSFPKSNRKGRFWPILTFAILPDDAPPL